MPMPRPTPRAILSPILSPLLSPPGAGSEDEDEGLGVEPVVELVGSEPDPTEVFDEVVEVVDDEAELVA